MGDPSICTDPNGVDRSRLGGDVGDAVELVDRGARGTESQPGEDTSEDHDQHQDDGQHDSRVEVGGLQQQPGGEEDRAGDHRRDDERTTFIEPDQAREPAARAPPPAAASGNPKNGSSVTSIRPATAAYNAPIQATATAASGSR